VFIIDGEFEFIDLNLGTWSLHTQSPYGSSFFGGEGGSILIFVFDLIFRRERERE